MNTLASFSSVLGTVWWSVLVFIAGAVIGVPLWNWTKKFLPWYKD